MFPFKKSGLLPSFSINFANSTILTRLLMHIRLVRLNATTFAHDKVSYSGVQYARGKYT